MVRNIEGDYSFYETIYGLGKAYYRDLIPYMAVDEAYMRKKLKWPYSYDK